jgi:hypothetical protein
MDGMGIRYNAVRYAVLSNKDRLRRVTGSIARDRRLSVDRSKYANEEEWIQWRMKTSRDPQKR